ncbi:hypothetical protein HYG81_00035 [Natrinema zhouii]|uniref:Small CPxCG-related zinc finger protein n=1 Tax=Natrinema zhouii TaxID=1710539 RepID=A0A7D6GQR6_9EURY|nr:hypothetical protein [Natrinema zhouii]QLK26062.1 hypothetical protein HYG81_00035 [Natrinema zhouii]
MRSQERPNGSAQSTIRNALESILLRSDDRTIIEECRRCGTTLESVSTCPSCGGTDIVEYRIR